MVAALDGRGAPSTAFILISDDSTWVASSDATREKALPSLAVAVSEADHLGSQEGQGSAIAWETGEMGLDPQCTSAWCAALSCSQSLSASEKGSGLWWGWGHARDAVRVDCRLVDAFWVGVT